MTGGQAAGFWGWDGWAALVAMGTIGLGLATAFLAKKTRDLAKETRDLGKTTANEVELLDKQVTALSAQAQLAKESHEHGLRPLLLDVPIPEVNPYSVRVQAQPDGTGGAVVAVSARNCGNGPAWLRGAALDDEGAGTYLWQARPSRLQWLPVNETERFVFDLASEGDREFEFGRLQAKGDFSVRVGYSDLAGNLWATRLDVHQDAGGPWEVYGVFVTGEGRAPD